MLAEAGYGFEVIPPDEQVEESFDEPLPPEQLVAALAERKGVAVAEQLSSQAKAYIVLGADTVAECDGRILGKARDEQHAREMLRWMSGREHQVLSGVCLVSLASNGEQSLVIAVVTTTLQMAPLTDNWLEPYLATGKWQGKAGAFGYQDGLQFVKIISGSESNVVGLPMEHVSELLTARGCLPRNETET